jgi:hypothetical protein
VHEPNAQGHESNNESDVQNVHVRLGENFGSAWPDAAGIR